MSIRDPQAFLTDSAGTEIASSTSAPAGTELGLIVRNIPPVNQTVTITGGVTVTPAGTQTVTLSSTVTVTLSSTVTVTPSGTQTVTFAANRPSAGSVYLISSATSSTTLLASNASRRKFMVHNKGNKNLYVLFNTGTATATDNFSLVLSPNGNYESDLDDYTGIIKGIWDTGANGTPALITEYT